MVPHVFCYLTWKKSMSFLARQSKRAHRAQNQVREELFSWQSGVYDETFYPDMVLIYCKLSMTATTTTKKIGDLLNLPFCGQQIFRCVACKRLVCEIELKVLILFWQNQWSSFTGNVCLLLKFQPQYKIATFVYRFFDSSLPGYLSQTLCAYEPTRNLCSLCEKLLKVPKHNTKTFGECSFSFLAPSVWNSLPSGLRNSSTLPLFKSRLKTHLFTTAFCL